MRYLASILVLSVLVACHSPQVESRKTEAARSAQSASPAQPMPDEEPPVQMLLASAAKDFRDHPSPSPARFRDVRVGHLLTPEGKRQYMLCGEFLPVNEGGEAGWIPFVTIKTSGYEQYVGAQAESYCRSSSVVWDPEGDLSSLLQRQLESLR